MYLSVRIRVAKEIKMSQNCRKASISSKNKPPSVELIGVDTTEADSDDTDAIKCALGWPPSTRPPHLTPPDPTL